LTEGDRKEKEKYLKIRLKKTPQIYVKPIPYISRKK
jgi:hypothetical protein